MKAKPHNIIPEVRRGGTWIQRWRVPLGFACAGIFLFFARPRVLTLTIGGGIALLGLGLRAWASGHVRKNDDLATAGPYAYTRNPLYLGSFIIGIGFSIAAGRLLLGGLFLLLFLGIYLPVMRIEAKTVAQLFDKRYGEYAKHVPMFVPRLTPYRTVQGQKFDGSLYLRYREYQASIGLLAAWTLLALKALYTQ